MYGKNVLVCGGAGFIGTNLIKKLVSLGANVRATLLHSDPQIGDFSGFAADKIDYRWVDLRKPYDEHAGSTDLCDDMDYVFMCAANTSGAAVMDKSPLVHVNPNVIMNTRILEESYAAGVKKFVFISSSVVYPVSDHHVKESEAGYEFFEKYFCAAWMKRFSETLCEMYATKIKSPMPVAVIRPGNVYGPYDDFKWETSHVLPALIRKVVERHDPISVWGDGSDVKNFIYVDDFVEGMIKAAMHFEPFDVFNIASPESNTIKEALTMMLDSDDYTGAKIEFDASKPTMIPKRLINIDKAYDRLGFMAETPLKSGLAKTIEWYRNVSNTN